MKKLIATALFSISLIANAGVATDVKIEGGLRNFYIQNNMFKVVTGKTSPSILVDNKAKKITIIQDSDKKFVEITTAELENMVNAASSLQNAFSSGKLDLKALTTKKPKYQFVNPVTIAKSGNTSLVGGIKGERATMKEGAKERGEVVFSGELAAAVSKDTDFAGMAALIINISSAKAIFEKLGANDKTLLYAFDAGIKSGMKSIPISIKSKNATLYEVVKSEEKPIPADQFVVPKGYTKKSLKEFLDGK